LTVRLPSLSFRHKLVIPSLVAAAATLAGTVVAARLSARAAGEIDQVERRHYPALELARELEIGLDKMQRQFQDAATAQDTEELEVASVYQEDLLELIAEVPSAALEDERAAQLHAAIQDYYEAAYLGTERIISRDQSAGAHDTLKAMAARYIALRERLATDTKAAREAMTRGFEEARTLQRRAVWSGAGILLLAALGAALLAWILAHRMVGPLVALNAAALRIADGDLTEEIRVDTKDEVGTLADSFRRMTERLRAIVQTLKGASTELGRAAERLSEHTLAQSAIVERQAAGVTETSATTRQLEQTSMLAATRAAEVLEVARRASEMSSTGQTAAERSVEGLQRIQGSVQDILGRSGRLLEQTRQVSEIVETVKDLAMQSHVLSLNASIEAARAGEAGKGFGVVASEVRSLAEQSGQSAARIARIVQDIVGAVQATLDSTEKGTRGVEGSVEQIRASGESLREIGGIVRETSDAALQIATAVQQQSQGVAQIATAMRDLDRGMEETVGRIQVLRESATDLTVTASAIASIANGFRI
jgi:methyl-accepting chemotaxis protein